MLVFFSDIHLTDGTSGETINAGAFDIFADQVADLARKRKAKEVRLVLLGDGLDVIRSTRWLDDPKGPRPVPLPQARAPTPLWPGGPTPGGLPVPLPQPRAPTPLWPGGPIPGGRPVPMPQARLPWEMSLYEYARGNPGRYTDPLGMQGVIVGPGTPQVVGMQSSAPRLPGVIAIPGTPQVVWMPPTPAQRAQAAYPLCVALEQQRCRSCPVWAQGWCLQDAVKRCQRVLLLIGYGIVTY